MEYIFNTYKDFWLIVLGWIISKLLDKLVETLDKKKLKNVISDIIRDKIGLAFTQATIFSGLAYLSATQLTNLLGLQTPITRKEVFEISNWGFVTIFNFSLSLMFLTKAFTMVIKIFKDFIKRFTIIEKN